MHSQPSPRPPLRPHQPPLPSLRRRETNGRRRRGRRPHDTRAAGHRNRARQRDQGRRGLRPNSTAGGAGTGSSGRAAGGPRREVPVTTRANRAVHAISASMRATAEMPVPGCRMCFSRGAGSDGLRPSRCARRAAPSIRSDTAGYGGGDDGRRGLPGQIIAGRRERRACPSFPRRRSIPHTDRHRLRSLRLQKTYGHPWQQVHWEGRRCLWSEIRRRL